MIRKVRVAIAQIDCTVGDLAGNTDKICRYIRKAGELDADIVSFPELSVTGYPPEDLLLKAQFLADNRAALKRIARSVKKTVAVVGFVDHDGAHPYNAAAVIYRGEVKGIYRKIYLPNYGVFDEKRYFASGDEPSVFRYGDIVFGVNICEDLWHRGRPLALQASAGADLIIAINSSPYHRGKTVEREKVITSQAREHGVAVAYTNLIGGQDELVFDGQSMVVDGNGRIIGRARAFEEDLCAVDIPVSERRRSCQPVVIAETRPAARRPRLPRRAIRPLGETAEVYAALTLGLRDYTGKNGFGKVVIALSGGIDSALVTTLAVDVLGKENVVAVYMPSRYSSPRSESDARALAANLGIKLIVISIEPVFKLFLMTLADHFTGLGRDTAEENLQARIRGNLIMTLSNKFGWLVLTTGNKSEMSTGYATLYGDMAGGFAVIKDVPKMLVYKLARYRNARGTVIPDSIIRREPTAELKPDQRDEDTLPPYGMLDRILKAYVEEDKGFGEIVAGGFDPATVRRVLDMVDRSEYKRRQSPPGIKITPKAFGKDRRMPITNKYR